MSIRDDFRTYLLTKSGITDLIGGSGSGNRIYPGFIPQGVSLPAVALNLISDVPHHDTDGANGWAEARIQVDCYGALPPAAEAVSEQIRLACDGYSGTMGSSNVQFCFKDDGGDTPESAVGNEADQRFRRRSDYRLAYMQTLPTL